MVRRAIKWTAAAAVAWVMTGTAADCAQWKIPVAKAAEAQEKPSVQSVKPVPAVELAKNAVSAALIDSATGQILFEKNPHQKLPPASVTKVMTMLLIVEAVDQGKIKWTDKIRTSEHASSMGGSQIFLEPGEEMTLDEMVKAIAMASANDAAVAVAERISGSEEEFVRQMNERAQQLGCKDTHFVNTNGLPAKDHYTSAYDLALMSRELLKHESIVKYTGKYEDYLRKDSSKPFWLVNTNKMVKWYQGMEGIKTGFTSEAKYCLSAAAKRGELRVIAVVMGEPASKTRNAEVAQMMDWAFANYTSVPIYKAGQVVQKVKISKGKITHLPLVAENPVAILMKKGQKKEDYTSEIVLESKLTAPIAKGDVVGNVIIKRQGIEITRVALVAAVNVDKASWWELTRRSLTGWLTFGSAGQ